MLVFLLGNAASALATSYTSLTLARFFSGLPHGAYFGVASLVAADLVIAERRGRAVSRVMLGLAVSNVAGVPAATWLGQNAGWRSAYWLVAALAALTVGLVLWLVPARRPATARPRAATSCVPSRTRRCCSRCSPGRSASAACSRCTPTSPRP